MFLCQSVQCDVNLLDVLRPNVDAFRLGWDVQISAQWNWRRAFAKLAISAVSGDPIEPRAKGPGVDKRGQPAMHLQPYVLKYVVSGLPIAQIFSQKIAQPRAKIDDELLKRSVVPRLAPQDQQALGEAIENLPRNRLGLARWLTRDDNPLTARVTVNRFWQQFFGTGLVKTSGDFGATGEWPSHPELLDWLAVEFMESGWDVKHLIRLMVTSATYRQSSARDEAKVKADPENKLASRFPVRRLEAEVIRDSILAVGGILDPAMHGPGSLDEASRKRSIYFTMKRSKLIPALIVFDAPDGTVHVGDRRFPVDVDSIRGSR